MMSEKVKNEERSPSKINASIEDDNYIKKQYEDIKSYEHHFNNLETEIRKFASAWLLAALGAIAYLVKGAFSGNANAPQPIMDPKVLISVVSLLGTFGLLVLWILDQMVYHRLLNAIFLLGIRMEYRYRFLPPIRTLMMLFSRKRGMARFLRLYYLMPICALATIGLISAAWFCQSLQPKSQEDYKLLWIPIVTAIFAILIPVGVYWKSKRMESYAEIAEGFRDKEFVKYLEETNYEMILSEH